VNKSRVAITAGAVFLSAALAVSLFSSQQSKIISPQQVLTWDCETAQYKPESITITCADGGIFVEKIQWSTWSKEGATGTGVYSENLCEPNCAEGERVTAPVKLTLTNLTKYKGKIYLRTLDINALYGKDFALWRTGSFQWDVMEFVSQSSLDGRKFRNV
jgi:hypothetical protein